MDGPAHGYDSPMPPLRIALVSQLLGLILAFGLIRSVDSALFARPLAAALLQGGLAAGLCLVLRGPPWWVAIQAAFLPLVVLATRLHIPPLVWLGGFFLLLAVFWRTDRSRVPLYLSNKTTAIALAGLMPPTPCSFLDLGCGTGSLIARLARMRPDCHFTGIEHAPLPWLIARLRTLGTPNVTLHCGDFWSHPLAAHQVIYVFLSPEPMPRLWQEAQSRAAPGALLVSNSFPVPGVAEESLVQVADRRQTRLYCYRPAGGPLAVPGN